MPDDRPQDQPPVDSPAEADDQTVAEPEQDAEDFDTALEGFKGRHKDAYDAHLETIRNAYYEEQIAPAIEHNRESQTRLLAESQQRIKLL